METARLLMLAAATVTTGLAAGLLYAFGCAVMPGLRRVGDQAFVATMRGINVAIVNGWFLLAFGGALVFTAAAAALHLGVPGRPELRWIVAALAGYVLTLVVTGRVNVPLNDRLAEERDVEGAAAARDRFERRWTRWHHVRTATSVVAFTCLVVALAVR
jgi:uncharacterized membrane protein